MKLLIVLLILVVLVAAGFWVLGVQQPSHLFSAHDKILFVAVKQSKATQIAENPIGDSALWRSTTAYPLVGKSAHWTGFYILPPDRLSLVRETSSSFEDVFAAQAQLTKIPALLLGYLRVQHLFGITQRPAGPMPASPAELGNRLDVLPSMEAINASVAMDQDTEITMVNFLEYQPNDAGDKTASRQDYGRYGLAALRTVHSVGGQYLFSGQIETVLIPSKQADAPEWDDLAAMIYPDPVAIFAMEHDADYRQGLEYRDRSVAKTVVIATQAN